MKSQTQIVRLCRRRATACVLPAVLVAALCFGDITSALTEAQKLNDLLARTADQTSGFLDQFSDVKCTEQVRQEKLGKDDKVELKEDSTYDYLVILTNAGGELNISESRIPVREAKRDRKNTSMLLSNGFATLFLVFHPYYAEAFRFALSGDEIVSGRMLEKSNFRACSGHEIAGCAGSTRTRISAGARRDGMDRSANRVYRQDRGRNWGYAG